MSDLDLALARTWPSERERALGAWRLRSNGGYTKRANSALALGDPGVPIDVAIEVVEEFYAREGLPARVQQSSAAGAGPDGGELASALRCAGFEAHERTCVQLAPVSVVLRGTAFEKRDVASSAAAAASTRERTRSDRDRLARWEVHSAPVSDEAWFETFWAESRVSAGALEPQARRLVGPGAKGRDAAWFVRARRDGRDLAVGQAVADGPLVGVQCMVTRPEARRAGAATAILHEIASWAEARGAQNLLLGVVEANEPAMRLYRGLGFETARTYVYWTK